MCMDDVALNRSTQKTGVSNFKVNGKSANPKLNKKLKTKPATNITYGVRAESFEAAKCS